MIFDKEYVDCKIGDRIKTEKSVVEKGEKKACIICNNYTSWRDVNFNLAICSKECQNKVWAEYEKDATKECLNAFLEVHKEDIKKELLWTANANPASKDILIVVHNQLSYLEGCINSVIENTSDYHVYIWDNNSSQETNKYLKSLPSDLFSVIESPTNQGFVYPNNCLAEKGKNDYIILLNSDTKVFPGWDNALIGCLQNIPEIQQVGYLGGVLDEGGKGYKADFGENVDYIPGWCSCFSRSIFEQYGLFDPNFNFAYCEDADFSLRLQSKGHKIYALHLMLVHHYENKTIAAVRDEGAIDVAATFKQNHEYLAKKWEKYLAENRVDLRLKCGLQQTF